MLMLSATPIYHTPHAARRACLLLLLRALRLLILRRYFASAARFSVVAIPLLITPMPPLMLLRRPRYTVIL